MRSSILPGPILLLLLVGCESRETPAGDPDAADPDAEPAPPDAAPPRDAYAEPDPDAAVDAGIDPGDGCSPVFRQDIFPEYHVEISATEEAALLDEFLNRRARVEAGLPEHPWHPVALEYVVDGVAEQPTAPVLIRLKGQSSWQQTVDLDENPKMQLVIAFNEVDHDGRFHGLRKVELDMPRIDWTFLKQRVALSFLREAGAIAQCANSARLFINGEYYGLYTHLERLDKEFIQRHFPDADEGDLWKKGRYIETNEDSFSWDRILALWDAPDFQAFDELADVDASIYEWAVEAMVGDADGYYVGAPNFFIYDHPDRGFLWIPHDLDTSFDASYLPADATPVIPPGWRDEDFWHHYLLVMRDAVEIDRYVGALETARSYYDVAALQERLDTWAAQIADAAAADPHRPFSVETHLAGLSQMRDYIAARAGYIDDWLACRIQGGDDDDDDGVDMCHDCNDDASGVYPGAIEICDLVDQDCDGRIDRTSGESVCPEPLPPEQP